MSTLEIILLVAVALLLLLIVGGAVARRRQLDAGRESFDAHLASVNEELAAARAGDRGWDPQRLDAVARAAWEERSGGAPADEIVLWRVVDRPGTDEDRAVYRVQSGGSETLITLARTGDDWRPEPDSA
jgi:hypothetical protein